MMISAFSFYRFLKSVGGGSKNELTARQEDTDFDPEKCDIYNLPTNCISQEIQCATWGLKLNTIETALMMLVG